MQVVNENDMIKEGRQTNQKKLTPKDRMFFRTNATFMGVVSGVLMSTFLAFTGFYISGDHAGVGFAKYIILGATLGILLSNVKQNTPGGATFKNGISFGLVSSGIAAITLSIMTIIINSFGETSTIKPYFQQSSGQALNTMVLAGVTLVETFVAGMILTFIWLQFLKDDSTVSESVR
jgi:hypothetical protein